MVFEGALRSSLRALILTGSLARDEAGFDIQDGGRCKVRGDAEFLVILQDRATDIPEPQKLAIINDFETQLRCAGINCYVSVGFVKAHYLANIKPHIFGYELRACGVVVTGETDILTTIPRFSSHDIPLEDGWQLLSNRIIELIGYAHEWIERPQSVSTDGRYRIVKLYLDMATSFLLFESSYEPTYSGRAKKLQMIAQAQNSDTKDRPSFVRELAELVAVCTRFKVGHNLAPDEEVDRLMERIGTRDSLVTAISLAHSLWRWELSALANASTHLSDEQMMAQWTKLQPISRRLPGWAYVLRRSGWHRSWKHWPAWALSALKASPRYWIYTAACELFFSLPVLIANPNEISEKSLDLPRMRSRLILKQRTYQRDAQAPLQQLCSEIMSNYREFLEGTRA